MGANRASDMLGCLLAMILCIASDQTAKQERESLAAYFCAYYALNTADNNIASIVNTTSSNGEKVGLREALIC